MISYVRFFSQHVYILISNYFNKVYYSWIIRQLDLAEFLLKSTHQPYLVSTLKHVTKNVISFMKQIFALPPVSLTYRLENLAFAFLEQKNKKLQLQPLTVEMRSCYDPIEDSVGALKHPIYMRGHKTKLVHIILHFSPFASIPIVYQMH